MNGFIVKRPFDGGLPPFFAKVDFMHFAPPCPMPAPFDEKVDNQNTTEKQP
jgi:hypothetical protein